MSIPAYPEPALTSTNRPLIEGWRRGELMLQRCSACSEIIFFPRELCPRCWSSELTWERSSGKGMVVSFSRVYSHVTEPFVAESPTVLAEIALTDGGVLLARVITSEPEAVQSGIGVELVPMPEAARYPLPTFRPIV